MDTNVNYTVVGLFVILLTAMLAVSIIWLSSGLSVHKFSTYLVYMRESVSGLTNDGPVEYNGVSVGNVKRIELDHQNPNIVVLTLKLRSDTPITISTVATLSSRGLTGITFLALKELGTDRRPIRILPGQAYPVIRSMPSLLSRLDTFMSKMGENFTRISIAVTQLLNSQNQREIRDILVNINKITDTIAGERKDINLMMKNFTSVTQQAIPFMQSSRNLVQLMQIETLPATNKLLLNLNTISSNLVDVSKDLKRNPSVIIRGKAQPSLGPGES